MGFSTAQGAVISVSVDGVAASQRQIESLNQTMGKLSQTVQTAMTSLAATAGLGGGLAAVIDMSDQYSKLTSQLRLATDSTSAYAAAYSQVKRISAESQSDLAGTGVLYARIANGTKELGISQQRVASITEVVNLALKVSGAAAEESASAQLQLSQAFAAGALRGEEFNAVNEAAPRLMKALADGMGVPVGALKQMASEGKITSEVMAEVLPKSLEQLRQEAAQVQTIGGAFTNLKNQVLEFTATSAQSNGTVAVLTGGIGLLADHLTLVAGALSTVTAVKAATWAQSWVTATYQKITADQAARTAALASAQAAVVAAEADLARVQATGAQAVATQGAITVAREEMVARLGQANATIASSEAAIAAATAAGAQSFALRTLRVATAELAVAETAHGAALAELAILGQQQVLVSAEIAAARTAEAAATAAVAVAQGGAAASTGIIASAIGLLGGPIGAVVAVLGVAATAWSVYGSKAEEANKKAADSVEASTPDIVANLEKQNVKLRERLTLMKAGPPTLAKDNGADAQQLASILTQINALSSKSIELKKQGQELDAGDQAQLYALGLQYSNLTQAMETNKGLRAEIDANGDALKDLIEVRERLTGVDKQYFKDLTTLQTAYEKGAIGLKEYNGLVAQLATDTYKKSETGKSAIESAKKEAEAYTSLIAGIRTKIETNKVELKVGQDATDSQKESAKLDQELASGKLKLSSAHLAVARAALVSLGATEQQLKQRDAEEDLAKWITASADARMASAATLQVEYALYGQSNDARDLALIKVRAEAEAQKKLDDMIAAHKPVTDQMRADLAAETAARVQVEQATLAQGKALQYAAQLADENKKFGLDYITDDRARAAAQLRIDADLWRQRIRLAGDGTAAQKLLEEQYDTWYQNQLAKPELEANKKLWVGIEQAAHDTFLSIQNGAKSTADRAKDAIKNGLFEWLYQMTLKKWLINIGVTTGMSGTADLAQAAGSASGNSAISAAQSAASMYSAGKTLFAGFESGFSGLVGSGISTVGSAFGSGTAAAYGAGMSSPSAAAIAAELGQGTATGSVAAAEAGAMGSGASAGAYAVPIAGWIAFGMAMSDRFYKQGWDANNGSVNSLGKVVNAPMFLANNILKGIGLSDSEANILAGMGPIAKLFGRKNPKIEAQGIEGTFDATGFSGDAFANIIEEGGWFRGDKRYTKNASLDVGQDAALDSTMQAMLLAVDGFAQTLGVSTDSITGYSRQIKLELTGDATKDQEAIAKVFGGIGDELSTKLVPDLAEFTKTGETASTTLQRLAGDFQGTTQVAQLLGKTAAEAFGTAGIESAKVREQLISFAGDLSTLTSEAQSYAQNYLTDAEKLAPVQKAVDAAMASLGLAAVQTRDQFKDVVNSLDLTTDAGAKEFTSLMALADAFAQVHPATNDAASAAHVLQERQGLQDQLDQLTMTSTQLLEKQRNALDASNRALFDQVQAAQAAKDAVQAQTAVIQALKDGATGMLGNVDGAYSVLQKVVGREKDLLQQRIDAETSVVSRLLDLSQSVHSTLDTMNMQAGGASSRLAAQAQIRQAAGLLQGGGSLSDEQIAGLSQAFGVVTQDASEQFGSYQDYLRDMYQTRNDIAALGDVTDNQLSVEQKSLDALQDQSKYLDGLLSNAQEQIDQLKGISTATLGVQQALQGLQLSMAAAQQNPVVSSASAINSAYQTYLNRAPDQAGFQWWQNAAANGTPTAEIVSGIANSTEASLNKLYESVLGRAPDAAGLQFWMNAYGPTMDAKEQADFLKAAQPELQAKASGTQSDFLKQHAVASFAVGVNYLPDDMLAQVHRGERIIPAADNRQLMQRLSSPADNSAALAGEIKQLREQNERMSRDLNAALVAIAKYTQNAADYLDAAINGDTPLATKVIAS